MIIPIELQLAIMKRNPLTCVCCLPINIVFKWLECLGDDFDTFSSHLSKTHSNPQASCPGIFGSLLLLLESCVLFLWKIPNSDHKEDERGGEDMKTILTILLVWCLYVESCRRFWNFTIWWMNERRGEGKLANKIHDKTSGRGIQVSTLTHRNAKMLWKLKSIKFAFASCRTKFLVYQ